MRFPSMTLSQRNRNPATLAGWMSTHRHFSSMMKNRLHLRDMAYPSRPGLIAMFDMNGIVTRFGSSWLWCWKRRWWCPWSSPTGKCSRNSTHEQPLDCLWNTGRPEKNSNNKPAVVIDYTSHKTTKNRKIPRVCVVYTIEKRTWISWISSSPSGRRLVTLSATSVVVSSKKRDELEREDLIDALSKLDKSSMFTWTKYLTEIVISNYIRWYPDTCTKSYLREIDVETPWNAS